MIDIDGRRVQPPSPSVPSSPLAAFGHRLQRRGAMMLSRPSASLTPSRPARHETKMRASVTKEELRALAEKMAADEPMGGRGGPGGPGGPGAGRGVLAAACGGPGRGGPVVQALGAAVRVVPAADSARPRSVRFFPDL